MPSLSVMQKTGYCIYPFCRISHLTRSVEIEQRIKPALEQDLFELALQPRFMSEDMSLCGYEALLRWHDPILGTVRPDVFMAIAARVNLVKVLDAWVLNKVFEQIHLWRQQGYDPKPVAVNITANHFADAGLSRESKYWIYVVLS